TTLFRSIMLLVRNPFELIALTKNAASNVGEILLQFPLYAGILGLMVGSGLVQIFSDAFVSIFQPGYLRHAGVSCSGTRELFCPLRWRAIRRSGTYHAVCRSGLGCRPRDHHYGGLLRRPVDQYDPALLGYPLASHRRAQDA